MKKILSVMLLVSMCFIFVSAQALPSEKNNEPYDKYENVKGLKNTHDLTSNAHIFYFIDALLRHEEVKEKYAHLYDAALYAASYCYTDAAKVYVIEKDGEVESVIRLPENKCTDADFTFGHIKGFDAIALGRI